MLFVKSSEPSSQARSVPLTCHVRKAKADKREKNRSTAKKSAAEGRYTTNMYVHVNGVCMLCVCTTFMWVNCTMDS